MTQFYYSCLCFALDTCVSFDRVAYNPVKRMKLVVVSLLIAVYLSACGETLYTTTENPYCNISTCSVVTDHTLCKYSKTTWGAACPKPCPKNSGVSVADIAFILGVHNNERGRFSAGMHASGNPGVQPPGSHIREMIWDKELAVIAQTHAQQCVFEHDTCRDVPRFRVNQNIYFVRNSTDYLGPGSWLEPIRALYNDIFLVEAADVESIPSNISEGSNHARTAWATTYTVGCGVAYFKSTDTVATGFSYSRLHVCNYGAV